MLTGFDRHEQAQELARFAEHCVEVETAIGGYNFQAERSWIRDRAGSSDPPGSGLRRLCSRT